jgi:hypothetical protein
LHRWNPTSSLIRVRATLGSPSDKVIASQPQSVFHFLSAFPTQPQIIHAKLRAFSILQLRITCNVFARSGAHWFRMADMDIEMDFDVSFAEDLDIPEIEAIPNIELSVSPGSRVHSLE